MDFDVFLSSPRWEILEILAENPSSPVEIAKKLGTTVSYISQQLKLLDAARLVLKKRTGAVEKGKPRTLFSLSDDLIYVSALTKHFSNKKLIQVSDYHKAIAGIWMLEDFSLHYYFEKLFWKLEEENVVIFLDLKEQKMIIVSDDKKLKQKIDSFVEKFDKKINYSFISKIQEKKLDNKLILLYDSAQSSNKLKGGLKNGKD